MQLKQNIHCLAINKIVHSNIVGATFHFDYSIRHGIVLMSLWNITTIISIQSCIKFSSIDDGIWTAVKSFLQHVPEPLFHSLSSMTPGPVILENAGAIREDKKIHRWKNMIIEYIQLIWAELKQINQLI